MDLGPEFLAEFSSPDREFHTVVTTKEPTQHTEAIFTFTKISK